MIRLLDVCLGTCGKRLKKKTQSHLVNALRFFFNCLNHLSVFSLVHLSRQNFMTFWVSTRKSDLFYCPDFDRYSEIGFLFFWFLIPLRQRTKCLFSLNFDNNLGTLSIIEIWHIPSQRSSSLSIIIRNFTKRIYQGYCDDQLEFGLWKSTTFMKSIESNNLRWAFLESIKFQIQKRKKRYKLLWYPVFKS